MDAVLATLVSEIAELADMLTLQHVAAPAEPGPADPPEAHAAAAFLAAVARAEVRAAELRAALDEETACLRAAEGLQARLDAQAALLEHMLAGAPAELRPPEPAKKKGKGAKGESAKAENEDPNSRRAVEGRKGSKFAVLPSVARPPREERKDRIDHLTEAEFALLPKYIIGRMTREKLNQSIDELNALVADKYTLLKLPAKSLSKAQRDRAVAYRDQERPETRDRCFVTEGEVRDTSKGRTRNDPAGKTVLAILRTTGRLKEVRGGGHNRLVIV